MSILDAKLAIAAGQNDFSQVLASACNFQMWVLLFVLKMDKS